ncbi:hypothetical protein TNCV_4241981 [Trichonephila clavipes]|nr:hypothetical protein TNCV_4241981 [Trichonephila clavipes]
MGGVSLGPHFLVIWSLLKMGGRYMTFLLMGSCSYYDKSALRKQKQSCVCVLMLVVKIYRFWNSGAGGAACKQKRVEVPGSEPGKWFVIDKGFGDLY